MYESPIFEPEVEPSIVPGRAIGVVVSSKGLGHFALVWKVEQFSSMLLLDVTVEETSDCLRLDSIRVCCGY